MHHQLYLIDIPGQPYVTIRAVGFMGENIMPLPMSKAKFMECFNKWNQGAMIQDAFKCLNDVQREFLKTGMSAEQHKEVFGKPEPEVNLN
jgi:hypothetical protein